MSLLCQLQADASYCMLLDKLPELSLESFLVMHICSMFWLHVQGGLLTYLLPYFGSCGAC